MSDLPDIEKVLIHHVCSLGFDCTSATVFQKKKIKLESHPFDWLLSNITDLIDCLETDFQHFLYHHEFNIVDFDRNAQREMKERLREAKKASRSETNPNIRMELERNISKFKSEITEMRNIHNHKYYNNIHYMHYPMIDSNYNYYSRCIERFKNLLKKEESKLFLIINRNTNDDNYSKVKDNIKNLNNTLKKCTTNFYILYVHHMEVKSKTQYKYEEINTPDIDKNVIFIQLSTNTEGSRKWIAEEVKVLLDNYFDFIGI